MAKFDLISIKRANTMGFTYTQALNELDNYWLADYPIEELFSFGYDICGMSMYGIKGNLQKEEKRQLKIRLERLLKDEGDAAFREELNELHKRNIIMIGFCAC